MVLKKFIFSFLVLFVLTSLLFSFSPYEVAKAQVQTPAWDFEDHTFSHRPLTQLTTNQIVSELTSTNTLFQRHGLPAPVCLAYPHGAYSSQVLSVVSSYRRVGRTADGYLNPETYPVDTWLSLHAVCMQADIGYSQIKSWIDTAISRKGLLNLFTHKVSDPPITYGTTPAVLEQVLDYLVTQQNRGNLTVMTMRQAYSGFTGQKAVVIISFDDGWVTDYTTVWPMFRARGLAGTSFIAGSSLDSGNMDVLTWSMVSAMAKTSSSVPTPPPSQTPTPTPTPPAPTTTQTPTPTPTPSPITGSFWGITVTSNIATAGTTNPSGAVTVTSGTLKVTAIPADGYTFRYWLLNYAMWSGNPLTLPPQRAGYNHTLVAIFAKT